MAPTIDGDAMPDPIVSPRPANTLSLSQRDFGGECLTPLHLDDSHLRPQTLVNDLRVCMDSTALSRNDGGAREIHS